MPDPAPAMANPFATALEVTRVVKTWFPDGTEDWGSAAFLGRGNGVLVTAHHVVVTKTGVRANRVVVVRPDGRQIEAVLKVLDPAHDLALLTSKDAGSEVALGPSDGCRVGDDLVVAGRPVGVNRISTYPAKVSLIGTDLISSPRCEVIQVAGMLNNGNSGGPVLLEASGQLVGIVTAKYVPLYVGIESLVEQLRDAPQFPTEVALQGVSFGPFANFTLKALRQVAEVLKYTQVGTGWAVPVKFLTQLLAKEGL